jgi:hypothetical protein
MPSLRATRALRDPARLTQRAAPQRPGGSRGERRARREVVPGPRLRPSAAPSSRDALSALPRALRDPARPSRWAAPPRLGGRAENAENAERLCRAGRPSIGCEGADPSFGRTRRVRARPLAPPGVVVERRVRSRGLCPRARGRRAPPTPRRGSPAGAPGTCAGCPRRGGARSGWAAPGPRATGPRRGGAASAPPPPPAATTRERSCRPPPVILDGDNHPGKRVPPSPRDALSARSRSAESMGGTTSARGSR